MKQKTPYHKLCELSKERHAWKTVADLLHWDQEIYMPEKGASFRAYQNALIAVKLHQCEISPQFKRLLSQVINLTTGDVLDSSLSAKEQKALLLWRKDYLHQKKIPSSFISEFTTLTSNAVSVWIEARNQNSFALFEPYLEKIVRLSQEKCKYLSYQDHPYDALLEEYEPGCTVAKLTPLFNALKEKLCALLKQIQTAPSVDSAFLQRECDPDLQFAWGKKLLFIIGFDPAASRLDHAHHPSCSGFYPSDIRMTTRIDKNNFISNIYSVLHEGGHGLYARGIPLAHYGTPLGEQASMSIDESQSRLWETRIGRSYAFWEYALPLLQEALPSLQGLSLSAFYQGINHVTPSFIRVEADEVTYCLHIILRFEIERDLISGALLVKDVPRVWREKMEELLGISPPSDTLGALQDIHWSLGYFGYFPTYALGNLYASQMFNSFLETNPEWSKQLSQGNFSLLHTWLEKHIYQYGRQFSPDELIFNISKNPLSEAAFTGYLTKKYQAIYAF
ncbi:MAG: carboxypeptidase M32 [Candidatus Rhabdochlamydia sp.]